MHGTYLRLDVTVWDSDRTVLRAARRKLTRSARHRLHETLREVMRRGRRLRVDHAAAVADADIGERATVVDVHQESHARSPPENL